MNTPKLSRRTAVAAGATLAAGAAAVAVAPALERAVEAVLGRHAIPGRIAGGASATGHRLRDGGYPAVTSRQRAACVIVGGGIAGLAAAWWLDKQGVEDVLLLELDDEVGGTSRSGSNAVSAYPWGAHYVPIPSAESALVRAFFTEIGVIVGEDDHGLPVYNELYLCSDPQERLYLHGRWQEGLLPRRGLSARDEHQVRDFLAQMRRLRSAVGRDGRPAFAVPRAQSSADERFRTLDQRTMAAFLAENGWDSPYLAWYVNYCMRDDFGCTADRVSAWAGVHYFAARRGMAANAQPGSVLTWPEGNGWLVQQLRAKVARKIKVNSLAYRVENTGRGASVEYVDLSTNQSVQVDARAVIVATPRFVASRIVDGLAASLAPYGPEFTYAPWMTANITVAGLPEVGGAPLSWDNVSFHGQSLGYVNATQQALSRYGTDETVLTFYLPLTGGEPAVERVVAGQHAHADWVRLIVNELAPMHPGIERAVSNVDIWLWGHGMIRPLPGLLTGAALAAAAQPLGNVYFAHSDLSGMALFEEAQYWGVHAAGQVLGALGGRKGV